MALTSAVCETSVCTNIASPPASRIIATVSSLSATRRAAITTFAPCSAKASAMARPIPEFPPVTSASASAENADNDVVQGAESNQIFK
jgi:hypothetical protein